MFRKRRGRGGSGWAEPTCNTSATIASSCCSRQRANTSSSRTSRSLFAIFAGYRCRTAVMRSAIELAGERRRATGIRNGTLMWPWNASSISHSAITSSIWLVGNSTRHGLPDSLHPYDSGFRIRRRKAIVSTALTISRSVMSGWPSRCPELL